MTTLRDEAEAAARLALEKIVTDPEVSSERRATSKLVLNATGGGKIGRDLLIEAHVAAHEGALLRADYRVQRAGAEAKVIAALSALLDDPTTTEKQRDIIADKLRDLLNGADDSVIKNIRKDRRVTLEDDKITIHGKASAIDLIRRELPQTPPRGEQGFAGYGAEDDWGVFEGPKVLTDAIRLNSHSEIETALRTLLAKEPPERREKIKTQFMDVVEGRKAKVEMMIGGQTCSFGQNDRTPEARARMRIIELATAPRLAIGSVNESVAHKIKQAWRGETMRFVDPAMAKARSAINEAVHGKGVDDLSLGKHIFLIQHDWAAAFASAHDYQTGEYLLPAEHCTFECRVNGTRFAVHIGGDHPNGFTLAFVYMETADGWFTLPPTHFNDGRLFSQHKGHYLEQHLDKLMDFFSAHIRAISIGLESEVAVATVVRAPHKLNHAREKVGKLPLFDFHVIDLTRRQRLEPATPDPDRETTRRRLHFVRGHWRHYVDHKTWIKWHYRGDPDLGFIDKEYRL